MPEQADRTSIVARDFWSCARTARSAASRAAASSPAIASAARRALPARASSASQSVLGDMCSVRARSHEEI
eukprot:scaffold36288_cov110-Isochrysis_galbana.AAC.9